MLVDISKQLSDNLKCIKNEYDKNKTTSIKVHDNLLLSLFQNNQILNKERYNMVNNINILEPSKRYEEFLKDIEINFKKIVQLEHQIKDNRLLISLINTNRPVYKMIM